MDAKEFSAKTVDQAITKASLELETSSENLEIQIIQEGSSGFLGFGSKPAKIKVRKKEQVNSPAAETIEKEKVAERKSTETKAESKNEAAIDEVKAEAEKFLKSVFQAMKMSVIITASYHQKDNVLDIDFAGEEMGILIGKRGQTLDSLQYLTSLVVNKGKTDYIRVKLDTENYRSRRKETLENLSKSIAYKVKKTRKPIALEPMNPYERRIIHSALQGNKYVETHSEGEDPYRHVVVKLKKL